MTRIKKRRSGKKRSTDRKKVSAGRRGRATKNEAVAREKKENSSLERQKEETAHKKTPEAVRQKGKARPAGARRVAAAKHIAAPAGGKGAGKKTPATAKKTVAKKKQGKGFAPWNKNKPRQKGKDAE
ncbi:MAG: hypothetical protein ABI813_09245 [Bacteroidota bacterium]